MVLKSRSPGSQGLDGKAADHDENQFKQVEFIANFDVIEVEGTSQQ